MYPGYAQAFRSDILNVGDIAAKLSNVKFTVGSDEPSLTEAAKAMLGIAVFINQEQYHPAGGQNGENVFKLAKALNLGADAYFTVGGVEFVRLSALEQADPEVLRTALENAEILCIPATDNRMDLFMGVAMDPDAKGQVSATDHTWKPDHFCVWTPKRKLFDFLKIDDRINVDTGKI